MPRNARKKWGVYVYYAADVPNPAMRKAAKQNLQKLADVGSNENVGITAMLDVTDAETQYYVIPPQHQGQSEWVVNPSVTLPNVNSACTDTIREFFHWSVDNCPAENIAFVFYGHGYAIDDYDPRLDQDSVPQSATLEDPPAVVPEMGRGSEADVEEGSFGVENSTGNKHHSRGFPLKLLFDSSYNAVLNNYQVADVIRGCRESLPSGTDFAILGFDCCNMAMAEVLCEMVGCAEIAVAAQTGLPFQSWISENILGKFLSDPPYDPKAFARTVIQDFIGSFASRPTAPIALSACDLNLCKSLETVMKPLSEVLAEAAEDPANRAAIFNSRNDCVSFDPDGFIDLDCFCRFLSEDLAGTAVAKACILVRTALRRFVIASKYMPQNTGKRISLATGLSIWFPPWIEKPLIQIPQKAQSINYFYGGYTQTRFSRATGWDKFLARLVEETQGKGNMEAQMAESSVSASTGLGKPPDKVGKPPDRSGRPAGSQGSAGEVQDVFGTSSSREAGVVIRASVEAYGPVGDTDLTINVRWPAASFGFAPFAPSATANSSGGPGRMPSPDGNAGTLLAKRPVLPSHAGVGATATETKKTAAKKRAGKAPGK
jgi:hypothetical protein